MKYLLILFLLAATDASLPVSCELPQPPPGCSWVFTGPGSCDYTLVCGAVP